MTRTAGALIMALSHNGPQLRGKDSAMLQVPLQT